MWIKKRARRCSIFDNFSRGSTLLHERLQLSDALLTVGVPAALLVPPRHLLSRLGFSVIHITPLSNAVLSTSKAAPAINFPPNQPKLFPHPLFRMEQLIKSMHERTMRLSLYHFGPVRNILMGAGFAYAVEKDASWWHYPLIFVFPTPYAGYNAFKQREAIRSSFQDLLRAHQISSTTISSEGVLSAAPGAASAATKELK